jgi:signal transduction histidine kinase
MRKAPTAPSPLLMFAALFVFLSLSIFSAEPANASDPILERSWLEDEDGVLSPEQALQGPWQPFDELFTAGLTRSTLWIRLLIDPGRAAKPSLEGDQRLVLSMLPVHLDEVAVFQSDRLNEPPLVLGDRYLQVGNKPFYQNTAVFERAAPFEVLLRVRTTGMLAVLPSVSRWDEAKDYSWQALELLQIFVFALLVVSFASLIVWIDSRAHSFLLFVAQLIMGVLMCVYLHGLYQLSDIDWVRTTGDRITSLIIPIASFFIASFHTQLMKELGARSGDIKLLRILMFGFLISTGVLLAGWINMGLKMHHLLAAVFLSGLNVVAWRFQPTLAGNKPPLLWLSLYLRFFYFLMAFVPMLQFLRLFTGINLGSWTLWAYTAVLPIGSLVMGIILLTRHYSEKINFASDAVRSRLEREHVEAQSDMIAMLAHELKTPLSVISLALSSSKDQSDSVDRAKRSVTNMRNILDHCEKALFFDHASTDWEENNETEKVDVCQLVSSVVDGFSDSSRIVIRTDDLAPVCTTDRGMLLIVTKNLVENALKYSADDSSVTVEVLRSEDSGHLGVIMKISNVVGAAGLPDSAQLFKKYYRSPNARQQSGSGLGLYLSHRMATRFGAVISLKGGAELVVFEVYVPLNPA